MSWNFSVTVDRDEINSESEEILENTNMGEDLRDPYFESSELVLESSELSFEDLYYGGSDKKHSNKWIYCICKVYFACIKNLI